MAAVAPMFFKGVEDLGIVDGGSRGPWLGFVVAPSWALNRITCCASASHASRDPGPGPPSLTKLSYRLQPVGRYS